MRGSRPSARRQPKIGDSPSHGGHLNVKSPCRLACQVIHVLPASTVSSDAGHAFLRHTVAFYPPNTVCDAISYLKHILLNEIWLGFKFWPTSAEFLIKG